MNLLTALLLVLSTAPLELEDVLTSTQRHHPLVLAALSDVDASAGDAQSARGGFDPLLKGRGSTTPYSGYPQHRVDAWVEVPTPLWGTTFFGGYRLGRGSFPPYYLERETEPWGEWRAGVSIPLLRNGPIDRRRTSIIRAELGQRIAQLSLDQQKLELMRQGAQRWIRWAAAGERRVLASALLELARMRQAQLEARERSGDLPSIDALDNRRAIVQREALLVSAQRSVDEAAFELSLFVRDEQGRPLIVDASRLPSKLPTPTQTETSPSLEAALQRRPDVARLAAQREQVTAETNLSRNQLLPAIDLGAAISQDLGGPEVVKRGIPEVEVMVNLEIPILYRQTLGRIAAATATERKLERQLQFQRERVRIEIQDSISAARAAQERARLMAQEVELARTLESGERKRMELGESNLFTLNLRETSTFETALKEVDARADWHRANADLATALALPLTAVSARD